MTMAMQTRTMVNETIGVTGGLIHTSRCRYDATNGEKSS